MFPDCLSNESYVKYQDLFSINFIFILSELSFDNNYNNDIKRFFQIINNIEYKGDIKKSVQWHLLKLFTTYIIPNEYYKLSKINEYLFSLLTNEKLVNLNNSHPLFYWINSIITSSCEGSCKFGIEDLLDILINFINIILKEEEFLNNLNFVKLSMKSYQFINNLNIILSKLNKDFAIIQLKYILCILPLLNNEINSLLKYFK
jgi:hypothetical protein